MKLTQEELVQYGARLEVLRVQDIQKQMLTREFNLWVDKTLAKKAEEEKIELKEGAKFDIDPKTGEVCFLKKEPISKPEEVADGGEKS